MNLNTIKQKKKNMIFFLSGRSIKAIIIDNVILSSVASLRNKF